MNTLLSCLWISFIMLLLMDTVALKLIPGDRTVMKKDGVTHTISKYYVVPSDFNLDKEINDTRSNLRVRLGNNNGYTKTLNQEITVEKGVASADNQSDARTVAVNSKMSRSGAPAVNVHEVNSVRNSSGISTNSELILEPGSASQVLETERSASGALQLENNPDIFLQRNDKNADSVKVWVKMPVSGRASSYVKDTNHPVNKKNSPSVNFLRTERILKGKPGGFNVRSLTAQLKPNQIRREDNVNFDPNLNLKTPWNMHDKSTNYRPWIVEDRQINWPWTFEDRVSSMPINFYPSEGSGLRISGDKLLLNSKVAPPNSKINKVGVKKSFGIPYVYAYVINPAKFLYKGPEIKSDIFKKRTDVFTTNNNDKVLINQPASSNYKSELSLSEEPSTALDNEPSFYNSELTIKKDVSAYGENADFISENRLSSTPSYKAQINVDLENNNVASSKEAVDNEVSSSYGSVINIKQKTSTKINNEENVINPSVLIPDKQANYYNSEMNVEFDQETVKTPVSSVANIPTYESNYVKFKKDFKPQLPGYIKTGVNTEFLVPELYGHGINIIKKPSGLHYLQKNQQTRYALEQLQAKMVPSYQLFSIDNLLKLHNALLNRIQNSNLNSNEIRALLNLRKINSILLTLAKYLGTNGGNIKWYENIFFMDSNPHPLQVYVYSLLRQKWLHEIMLLLYKNNFNLNILNSPRLYGLLGAWRLPSNVNEFMVKGKNLQDTYEPIFQTTYGAHNLHGLQGNIENLNFEDYLQTPTVLDQYRTENIVDQFKTQNGGYFLNILGANAGIDANAVIDILKKYLIYKNHLEKQENIINTENKVEMFKQIVLFLRQKGYGGRTILDLINKLYGAVYSMEGKPCSSRKYNNLVHNMYDVIVPVLRRSGEHHMQKFH